MTRKSEFLNNMATIYGSPTKSELITSRMEKYIKNLNNDAKTPLKALSPSRINSARNLNEIANGSPAYKKVLNTHSPSREIFGSKTKSSNESPSISSYFHSPSRETKDFDASIGTPSKYNGKDKNYYEFLCRVAEAKQWIESIISESLPSVVDLVTSKCMSDGVYLAKLVQKIKPELVSKIVPAGNALVYAHTQNINVFFDLVDYLEVPSLFRFELTDLYERKNVPKVFETIHAVASLLSTRVDTHLPQMQNMTGHFTVNIEDIKRCQRKIPNVHAFRPFNQSKSRNPSPQKSCSNHFVEEIQEQRQSQYNDHTLSLEPPKTPSKISSATSNEIVNNLNTPVTDISSHSTSITQLKSPMRLTYSPDRTFSYYSPGISRNLSYRTEEIGYFNRRRVQNQYDYEYYDTFRYSSSNYSPTRRQRMSENQFLDSVTDFQAILKGLNVRYRIHLKNLTLEHKNVRCRELQSFCKGILLRRNLVSTRCFSSPNSLDILQAVARGTIVRQKIDHVRFKCLKNERHVVKLQIIARSAALRYNVERKLQFRNTYASILSKFQAKIRAIKQRSSIYMKDTCAKKFVSELTSVQAIVRGKQIRIYTARTSGNGEHINLQAVLKGALQRKRIIELCEAVSSPATQQFSAFVRGYIISKKYVKCTNELPPQISQFNAVAKGVLTRFAIELINDVIEENQIAYFQARASGFLVRKKIENEDSYYVSNVLSVVIIQNHIRKYQIQNAYVELMSSACPSLSSIKKFVHILNSSDGNMFSTQLQRIKKEINETNEEFNELEEQIEIQIRRKESLEKRRINVSKYLSPAGCRQLQARAISTGTSIVSKNLLILYSKVGFLLQVDPFYWKLLSREAPEFCIANLPKIYAPVKGSINIREQILFTRVIGELLAEQLGETVSASAFLDRKNSVWNSLLQEYLISFRAQDLNRAFSQLYKYLDSELVDFESDPSKIYRKMYPTASESPAYAAIVDPDTSSQYVKNMTSLWTAVETVCAIVDQQSLQKMSELKYICSEAYQHGASIYGDELSALKAIGSVILRSLLYVALERRNEIASEPIIRDYQAKSSILMKTLEVVFGFEQFVGYFESLNPYLLQSQDNIVSTVRSLLVEPDERKLYENIIYTDMANESRPSLTIYHQNFIKIIKKFGSIISNVPHDDPILNLINGIELEYDKNSVSGQSQLVIPLDPTVYRVPLTDDRSALLYHEAKIGICCCIQIEDVSTSLTELLLSEILPEDEVAFQHLLEDYNGIEKQLFNRHGGSMTYREMKRFLLHRIRELTALEIVDKSNDYQFILTDIANSIKSSSCIKELNDKEIKLMESVHGFLQNKYQSLQYLKEALHQANLKSISDVQTMRKYAPMKKSGFGSKIKDVYQKAHNKNSEESTLTLKWSVRQLVEAEVLVKMEGENLRNNNVSFFGSSGSKYPDIDVKISTKDGEIFGFEMLDNRKKKSQSLHTVLKFSELIEKEGLDLDANVSIFTGKTMVLRVEKLLNLLVDSYFAM